MTKKRKKRYRLKKQVYYFFIVVILISIFINSGIKKIKYKNSYEYKLIQLNYTEDEAKLLSTTLDDSVIDNLLKEESKNRHIVPLIKSNFFKKENLDRYLAYIGNKKKPIYEDVINTVNINRDYDYYEVTYSTDTSENEKMLVNKYYLLSSDYVPDDLVDIAKSYSWGDTKKIREITYNAFIEMFKAAEKDGFYLMINSGYRSYTEQEEVYNDYKNDLDTNYADSIAARPGASEHQTGLALDIFEKKNSSSKTFKDTDAYQWLRNNSYKFGFILRYAEGTENITGYSFESWHYRYVGKDIAKKVHDLGITYDEYYANYMH